LNKGLILRENLTGFENLSGLACEIIYLKKISFENLTGFENLSGLACDIIYLKKYIYQ